MKLVKMSLAAALLMGASAYAIDNTKVSGDAKLYYSTMDADNAIADAGLFENVSSYGQAALGLGITSDLLENVSAGAHVTALSTLGLQGQLVNGVWEATNGVDDYWWMDELWIAATMGKTTAKVGRMALDTPLVFSESWTIATNTFEGAVLLNQNIPDTTLVAAYVGGSNGNAAGTVNSGNVWGTAGTVIGAVNANGTTNFAQFYDGAYAVGVVNNSWKPLTAQAWYYDATHAARAYWLQADLAMDFGLLAGVQYTDTEYQKNLVNSALAAAGVPLTVDKNYDNDAVAGMIGFAMKDVLVAKVAYSQTGKTDLGVLKAGQNLATNPLTYSQSKLYTEAWWNYGYITQEDTQAINVTLTSSIPNAVDLGLYYTMADQSKDAGNADLTEFTFTVGKTFGALDTTLAYIYTQANDQNVKAGETKGDAYNTIQAYLTLNF